MFLSRKRNKVCVNIVRNYLRSRMAILMKLFRILIQNILEKRNCLFTMWTCMFDLLLSFIDFFIVSHCFALSIWRQTGKWKDRKYRSILKRQVLFDKCTPNEALKYNDSMEHTKNAAANGQLIQQNLNFEINWSLLELLLPFIER